MNDLPTAVVPTRWVVCFDRTTTVWWARWLAFGRYKHVRAYAYLTKTSQWLFFDVSRAGLSVFVAPDTDETIRTTLWAFTEGCDLIRMPARTGTRIPVFGWCVPAIRHLIGVPGFALRPDALWRACVRAGGVPSL